MGTARAMQLVIVLFFVLFWTGQDPLARQVVATTHKSSPGVAADSPGNLAAGSANRQSSAVLRPADAGLVKGRPGQGNVLSGTTANAQLERRLSARTAVVVDSRTGRIIFALNPDVPRQPASTIKVLTALIALDSLRESQLVPTSRRAAQMPRSKIYLQQGRSYRAGDLINAVLLRSGNDASVALAEMIAGSERAFARLMTSKAREMGASNTTLVNSNGLTASGQVSTARDLALILHQAMQHPELARRIGTTTVATGFGQTLRSNNQALWRVEGSKGGKTGYTSAAQQTYVGKFQRGEQEIVIALMGSQKMWDDVNHLVKFGFQQLGNGALMAAAPIDDAFTRRAASSDAVAMTVLTDVAKSGL